jgi:hypothetical protein
MQTEGHIGIRIPVNNVDHFGPIGFAAPLDRQARYTGRPRPIHHLIKPGKEAFVLDMVMTVKEIHGKAVLSFRF